MTEAHPFHDMHEHGFVRVATATPATRTADVAYNTAGVLAEARKAHAANVDLVVFPELTLSSYAIDDLLLQHALLERVEQALAEVVAASTRALRESGYKGEVRSTPLVNSPLAERVKTGTIEAWIYAP